ncbi:TolC family protein [Phenylobacterium sp. LjRoot225]|uniref:efflux transporter outer membrane subunit n=1 Tax=Phenylobacterium sp. LjRoot225 TaxID=3342285 RepID=UPI003ECC8672
MRSVVYIAAPLCFALAACGSAPKPDLRLPVAYEAPQPAPAGAVALDRWWTTFDDPQLTALIDQALVANPDVKSAAARLLEARASRQSSLFQFLPQGDAKGSATRTDTRGGLVIPGIEIPGLTSGGATESYSANFDVSWEVDLFGRFLAARKVANADVAAAGFDYVGTRTSLAAQVADAYFQARGLAIQLADARETARIQRELYELAAKRAQAGLATTADADRVAGDLSQSEAQVASLEAELQVQRRTLLILAGRTVEPTSSIDVQPFVAAAPVVPAAVPSELLRRRPDVRQAEAQLRAAIGSVTVARLAFLPTFTLKPGYGWSKTIQGDSTNASTSWSLGGAVSQPVLNIPSLLAQAKVYDARARQSAAGYEKAVQTAFGEAEGALVRLDADRRRVALLTDGEARAQRAFKAARLGYSLGLNDLQDTLSAEQSWRATRTQLTSAQVEAVRRAVQAYKAIGGGWSGGEAPSKPQATLTPAPDRGA